MKKPAFIPLASLAILLLLVALVTFLTSRDQNNTTDNSSAPTTSQSTSQSPLSPTKASQSDGNGAISPTTAKKSSPVYRASTPQGRAVVRAQSPEVQQSLKKLLARDESLLTREEIPGGGELIHLNGSQAHIAGATISADGTIETTCHSSYEGLVNATPTPPSKVPSPAEADQQPPSFIK